MQNEAKNYNKTFKILDRPDYRIGFAGTYFTLWTVRTNTVWKMNPVTFQHFAAGTSVAYTFIQNLSKDEAKAIAKAKAMGATNLTPDPDLRGKRGSFVRYERAPEEPKAADTFHFGKYRDKTFAEVDDLEYLFWYHNNATKTDNIKAACDYLLENGGGEYTLFKGDLYLREDVDRIKRISRARAKAKRLGYVEGIMERNINDYGFTVAGVEILVGLLPLKQMFYQEFTYYLPVIDGKAKRVKGKKVRVYIEEHPAHNDVDFAATKIELV